VRKLVSRLLLAAASCTILCPALRAQNVPTIHVDARLIDTTFSVHDASGHPVHGLTQNDFTVTEDGIPQTIRFFFRDAQLPLSIGLIIDSSGSQDKFVKAHEHDIEAFLHQVLGPNDQAFAICFGNYLRMVSDYTSSPKTIVSGIHLFNKGDRNFPVIGPAEDRDLGTALYDAVYYSITQKLAGIHQRRKVLVVFSDGEENSSEHDLLDAIEAAQNSDVLIYAVRYTELTHGQMNARDRYGVRVLDHLSAETGGRAFDAHSNLTLAFTEIADDLRSLYELAYPSTNHERDGAYRKVVIRTTQPGLTVRARTGYYAR